METNLYRKMTVLLLIKCMGAGSIVILLIPLVVTAIQAPSQFILNYSSFGWWVNLLGLILIIFSWLFFLFLSFPYSMKRVLFIKSRRIKVFLSCWLGFQAALSFIIGILQIFRFQRVNGRVVLYIAIALFFGVIWLNQTFHKRLKHMALILGAFALGLCCYDTLEHWNVNNYTLLFVLCAYICMTYEFNFFKNAFGLSEFNNKTLPGHEEEKRKCLRIAFNKTPDKHIHILMMDIESEQFYIYDQTDQRYFSIDLEDFSKTYDVDWELSMVCSVFWILNEEEV